MHDTQVLTAGRAVDALVVGLGAHPRSAGDNDPVIRLIATDLDGTVVRHDGVITDRTRAALKLAADAGIDVVFVTGRPPRWLSDVAAAFGHVGLAICGNGAMVWDLEEERVLASHLMDPATAVEVAQALRTAIPGVAFAVELADGEFAREADYVTRWDVGAAARIGPLAEITALPLVKLLMRHEEIDSDDLLARALPLLTGVVEVTHSTAGLVGGLLELSAAGVSKASTLAQLCAERGISPGEVMAFGDMPNDLAMLRWVGEPYVMASGHPSVVAAIGRTAPACDEDGVAQVVEALVSR